MEKKTTKNEDENSINIDTVLIPHRTGTSTSAIDSPAVANATQMQRDKLPGGITGKGFQPGQSGNPAGKVPGTKNLTTRIREGLARLGAKDAQGNPLPVEEALAQKIIKMALDGDRKMIELVWNYLDGKPPQNIDLTSKGERVGTVVLSAEEEKRIEELFAPRVMLPPTKENANNKLQPNKGNGSDNDGGDVLLETKQSGSAYEIDS